MTTKNAAWGDDDWVNCPECGYAKPPHDRCPNPACFPGLRRYQEATAAWERQRDAALRDKGGMNYNMGALREQYERSHPRPTPQQFRKSAVAKGREWPQCDGCGAPEAAQRPDGEPWVVRGQYLCPRCARGTLPDNRSVAKHSLAESHAHAPDFEEERGTAEANPTQLSRARVAKEDDSGRLYSVRGMSASGDEDEGNYSNPDERPLYQKAGDWPDELWTNTDPDDKGKQAQAAISDSERYYLNKASDGDCDDCAFFRGAGRPCAVVRAPISPEGVCDYWSAEEKPHPSGLSPEDANYRSPADQQDSDSERYYLNKAGDAAATATLRGRQRTLALAEGEELCAVGVVLRPGEGRVLLGRKDDDGGDLAGKMVFPGGHVEAGEDVGRAAAREVYEETGVWATPVRVLGSVHKDGNEVWFVQLEDRNSDPSGPVPGGQTDDVLEDADFYPYDRVETDLNRDVLRYALGRLAKAEHQAYFLDRAAYADRALAYACEGVLLAAVAKGISGADVRTALALVRADSSILSRMSYDPQLGDWTSGGRGLGQTLERVARLAKAAGEGELYNAAEGAKDLVDRFRPASYDDVRAGIAAADQLLENLGYDEPSVRKAVDEAEDDPTWYPRAGAALRRALDLLSDDAVAKAVGDDRELQLAAAREELELLAASMALDSRVRNGTVDEEAGGGHMGYGELDVVNATAPETLDHVEEADDLLASAGIAVPENPLPTGQRSQGGTPGVAPGTDGTGNGQGIHNAYDTSGDSDKSRGIDRGFTHETYSPKAQRAQWETGQRIADAAWGGEPYDQTGTFRPLDKTLQGGWQVTDPTGGLWDSKHGRDQVEEGDADDRLGEGAEPQSGRRFDDHPSGDSGRGLEMSVVSRAEGDPPGFEPDEDEAPSGRAPAHQDAADTPRLYKEDAVDPTVHVGGGRTFQDGPMPSHGPRREVGQHVPSQQSLETTANLRTSPDRGDSPGRTVRKVTGAGGAVSPDPLVPPSHLQEPEGTVEPSEVRGTEDGHYNPDVDQRGADVNPLNLAQGDEDVRVLSRAYAQLFRNVVSDPTVRFAVLRREADGSEREIPLE